MMNRSGKLLVRLLVVVVALQALVLAVYIALPYFPVKGLVLGQVNKFLRVHEVRVEAQDVLLELDGVVAFEGLSVFYKGAGNPVFESKHLEVSAKLMRLLGGKLSLDDVKLVGGLLRCPALFSPTGVEEVLLEDVLVLAELKEDLLYIRELEGVAQNVLLNVTGRIDLAGKTSDGSADDPLLALGGLSKALEYRGVLKQLKQSAISVNLDWVGADKRVVWQASVAGIDGDYKQLPIHTAGVEVTGQYRQTAGEHWLRHARLALDKVIYQGFEFQNVHCEVNEIELTKLFEKPRLVGFDMQTGVIKTPYNEFDQLLLACEVGERYRLQGQLMTQGEVLNFEVGSAFEDFSQITGRVRGKWNPLKVLNPYLEAYPVSIQLKQTPYIELDIEGEPWKQYFEVPRFKVSVPRFQVNEMGVDLVSVLGKWQEEAPMVIDDLTVELANGDWVTGQGEVDLQARKATGGLRGVFNPASINSIVKSEDWDGLWAAFQFKSSPKADVTFDLDFNDLESASIRGKINGEEFSYNEVPVTFCDVQFNANQHKVEVEDLVASNKSGEVMFKGAWNFRRDLPGMLLSFAFEGKSTLPVEDVLKLADNNALNDSLKALWFSKAPVMSFEGIYYIRNPEYTEASFELHSNQSLKYNNIPIDYLSFVGKAKGDAVVVEPIKFGIASGVGEAEAKFNIESQIVELKAKMDDCQTDDLITALSSFDEKGQLTETSIGGEVSVALNTVGKLDSISSFYGQGQLSLEEAVIAKANLLGGLSEVLQFSPLGVTSLKFTDLKSKFTLDRGKVDFDPLTVTGNYADLTGSGSVDIRTQEIQYLLDVFPKAQKSPFPLFSQTFGLIQPLAQNLQVTIQGTLNDPKYGVKLKGL